MNKISYIKKVYSKPLTEIFVSNTDYSIMVGSPFDGNAGSAGDDEPLTAKEIQLFGVEDTFSTDNNFREE